MTTSSAVNQNETHAYTDTTKCIVDVQHLLTGLLTPVILLIVQLVCIPLYLRNLLGSLPFESVMLMMC